MDEEVFTTYRVKTGDMRVLLVQDTDWLVRGPHQQHHLMERLSLKGHEIRVIDYELLWTTQGKKALYSKRQVFHSVSKIYSGGQVTVIRPGIIKVPWLDYVSLIFTHRREINFQIREFRPNVIVGFGILGTYLAMKLAKRNNIPFIYYLIDVLHMLIPFKPFQLIARMIEKKILKNADAVISLNSKLKDYLLTMGAESGRTHVVTAGVDFGRFKTNLDGDDVRMEYSIAKDDFVLFFMGRLDPVTGLKEAILEFARVKGDYSKLKFLIVGDGELYPELIRIRRQYNMESCVILTGKQPYERIPEFVAAADVCLLPFQLNDITREVVPIKMYEYMASGRPVVATSLPGVRQEMGDDKGIIYVDSPSEVVRKAVELLDNKTNLAKYGIKNRSFAQKYSWDNITDEFEKIFEAAIKEKRNECLSKRV